MSAMAKKQVATEGDRHKGGKLVRISDELHAAFAAIAEEEHRPLTWQIELALKDWLDQRADKSE